MPCAVRRMSTGHRLSSSRLVHLDLPVVADWDHGFGSSGIPQRSRSIGNAWISLHVSVLIAHYAGMSPHLMMWHECQTILMPRLWAKKPTTTLHLTVEASKPDWPKLCKYGPQNKHHGTLANCSSCNHKLQNLSSRTYPGSNTEPAENPFKTTCHIFRCVNS